MKCDEIPNGLDLCLFDFGVNAGPGRAAKFLQKIIGTTVDGGIGPQTLNALQQKIGGDDDYGISDIIKEYQSARQEYYEGLLNKKCYINPTLMIEDSIKNLLWTKVEKNNVIIGGNLRRWYGGFNSLIVAQEFNESIWAPQMGRMREDEKQLEDLNHLPYMEWVDWMYSLNKFKYAVHLNPNSIGGTFSLNCAYLGLPCIGNIHSNTQRLCFPDLSLEPDNLKDAKKLAKKLRVDKDFYLHCSNTSKKLYDKHFSENTYNKVWKEILNKINNEN